MDDKFRNSNQDAEMADLTIKAAEVKQPLTLAHLPDTCLNNILTNLDLDDLTNAADANNGLTESAIHVFKTKFIVDRIEYSHYKNELFSKQLKYFGPSMSTISIWGRGSSDTDIAKVFDLMLKYCGPTLNKLRVRDIDYKFELKHKFPSVQKLCFGTSETQFNDSWTQFKQYFPSLRTLKFNEFFDTSALNPSFSIHIPSLQRLIFSRMSENFLTMAQIVNANPQITHLKVTCYNDVSDYFQPFEVDISDFESNVDWSSLNITKLEIEGFRLNPKYVAKLNHLNSLSFETDCYDTTLVPLKQPIIELSVLAHGTLENKDVDFIVGFPKLKRLTIKTNYGELESIQMNRMATELQELAEVNVIMKTYSRVPMNTANGILELIRKCENLRSLKLVCDCMIFNGPATIDELFKDHAELKKEFQRNINGMAKWIMTTKSWKYFENNFFFTYNFVTDN